MNKILIIQTASIGDVILSTPILEKLQFYFPKAKIDFLLKKGNEALFNSHPFLHSVIIWDKTTRKYKNLFRLIKYIRSQKYDCVINIQRFTSSGLLTLLSSGNLKIGFNKNPLSLFFNHRIKHSIGSNIHEAERNLRLIEKITDQAGFPMKLYPSQQNQAKVSQYKTVKYITISPASIWFTKQFPEEKWVEFLSLIDQNLRIYFLGSTKDKEMCERIIGAAGNDNTMNLCGRLHFLESAALMKDAQMNFVNDSAPLHLASSVNAPITAIFCSTVPEFGFGPRSENSAIIQTSEILKCKPCGLHGFNKCPEKHFRCAKTIKVEKLLNRLE